MKIIRIPRVYTWLRNRLHMNALYNERVPNVLNAINVYSYTQCVGVIRSREMAGALAVSSHRQTEYGVLLAMKTVFVYEGESVCAKNHKPNYII